MLEDAREIPTGTRIVADICVVGAGPAGLSVVLDLIGSGLDVCVLEAGGRRPDRATQSLLEGETSFDPAGPLQEARLACLGGTTRVWGGWCRPLDAADFAGRRDDEGWPFGREHLDPFYRRAHELCGLGPFDYDVGAWCSGGDGALPLPEDLAETRLFHISPPTRFGHEYRPPLRAAARVRVLLRAVCAELLPEDGSDRVGAARVVTLEGGSFEVTARHYVLAAGGIENARLLLLSDRLDANGLGNASGLVGRYFMEHPYVTAGRLHLEGSDVPLEFYRPHRASRNGGSSRVRGVWIPAPDRVRADGLLGSAHFPLPSWAPSPESEGATALGAIARLLHGGWLPAAGGRHLLRALRDPTGTLGALYHRLVDPRLGRWSSEMIRVRSFCEAEPLRSRRVRLSDARDALGRRRIRVEWSPSDLELRSLRRGQELVGRALADAGIGRLECSLGTDQQPEIETASHHMGTTRMHPDPARGVVDANCRVHGHHNLFIAGSSVFPTAGFANPTLTIVALALRLADHLRARARRR